MQPNAKLCNRSRPTIKKKSHNSLVWLFLQNGAGHWKAGTPVTTCLQIKFDPLSQG